MIISGLFMNKKNNAGFSLIEVILATAIFSLLISSFVGAYLYGQEATAVSGNRIRANLYAKEGMEAVRNIRDDDFNNLSDGAYGLRIENGKWSFVPEKDESDIFTRTIEISSLDEERKEVQVNVSWMQNAQRDGLVSLRGHFTNWMKIKETGTPDDFIGYWPLDENSGCLTYDVDGNHEGVLSPDCPAHSPTWINGKVNSALFFDNEDSMVVVDNSSELNPRNEITLSAWVKWESDPALGNEWATIINKNGDSQYRLQHNRTNEFFEFAIRTSSGNRWIISTTSPQEGIWYHVAGTYDGETMKIYVNSVMENSTNWSGEINSSTSPLIFGNRIWGDRLFEGIIDEIGLWGRALSEEEIEQLYLIAEDYDDDEDDDDEDEDDVTIESCNDYCLSVFYEGGVCRQNRNRCENNETYEEDGDDFCPGRFGENACCCF